MKGEVTFYHGLSQWMAADMESCSMPDQHATDTPIAAGSSTLERLLTARRSQQVLGGEQ